MTGAGTVFIESKQAAVKGSRIECSSGPTVIETGSPTVRIESHFAARRTDTTCHKGMVITGARTVFIGNGGGATVGTLDRAQQSGSPFVRG